MKIYHIAFNGWYKTAVADGEFRDLRDKVNNLKDEIRNLKKDDKDFESRIKKIEKIIDELNIGQRLYQQNKATFNSIQRKMERFETIELEWKKYKGELSDSVRKEVEKHTRARVSTLSPGVAK